ncbi:hypothetical protein E1B28_010398 [Marasmius oreades]|uniref:Uncharacterized protein n=1 Tax=Marasmius oreades TaxID=181124 RepID=A0A9P7RY84_9AGAR|nr:uncharacterized protein E1B28_010398 [Marasmius oreades]KAG7091356.1 hypothetical protein E1B28_010398 [Marasmius oreades]
MLCITSQLRTPRPNQRSHFPFFPSHHNYLHTSSRRERWKTVNPEEPKSQPRKKRTPHLASLFSASESPRTVRVENISSTEVYEELFQKARSLGPIQNVYPNSKTGSLNLVLFNTKSAERVVDHIQNTRIVNSNGPGGRVGAEYSGSESLPSAEVICGIWRGYSRAFYFVPAAGTPTPSMNDLELFFGHFGKVMSLRQIELEFGNGSGRRAWRVSFCSFLDGFRAATGSTKLGLKGTILPIPVTVPKPAFEDFPAYIHSLSSNDSDNTSSSRTVSISVRGGGSLSLPLRELLYELTTESTVESCFPESGNSLTITLGSPREKTQFVARLYKFLQTSPFHLHLDVKRDPRPDPPLSPHRKLAMTLGASRRIIIFGFPTSEIENMDNSRWALKNKIQKDISRYGIVKEVQIIRDDTVYVRLIDINSAVSALIALNHAQHKRPSEELSDYRDVKVAKFALNNENKRMNKSFNDGYIPRAQSLWSDPEELDSGLNSLDEEVLDLRYWLGEKV